MRCKTSKDSEVQRKNNLHLADSYHVITSFQASLSLPWNNVESYLICVRFSSLQLLLRLLISPIFPHNIRMSNASIFIVLFAELYCYFHSSIQRLCCSYIFQLYLLDCLIYPSTDTARFQLIFFYLINVGIAITDIELEQSFNVVGQDCLNFQYEEYPINCPKRFKMKKFVFTRFQNADRFSPLLWPPYLFQCYTVIREPRITSRSLWSDTRKIPSVSGNFDGLNILINHLASENITFPILRFSSFFLLLTVEVSNYPRLWDRILGNLFSEIFISCSPHSRLPPRFLFPTGHRTSP